MSKEDCTRLGDALLSAMASWANATPSDRNEHTTEVRDAIERFHDAIMSACGRATIKGLPDGLEGRTPARRPPTAGQTAMKAVGNIAEGEAVMAYSLRQLEAAMRLYEAAKAALDVLEVVGNAASFHNNNTPGVGQTVDYQDDHGSIRQQLRQQLKHFEEAMFPPKAVTVQLGRDAANAREDASGFYHCPKCGEPYSSLDGAQLCCDPDDCRPTAYRDLTPKD